MKVSSLRGTPSEGALSALRACAGALHPKDQALREWHEYYLANHLERVAHDYEMVLSKAPAGAAVLECGSIPLLLTAALQSSGLDVTGCDIAPERYASVIEEHRLTVVKANVETDPLPFDGDAFDVVVFNEIFEHLRINPIATLTEVLRVLKPGGVMLLSTPNLRSLNGIINFLFRNRSYSCVTDVYEQYSKLDSVGHMGHVREYTSTEVVEFLERVGFEVTEVIFRGKYQRRSRRLAAALFDSWLPYASYVASKPGGEI